MKQLFPVEIVENSVQTHWTKRHSKSKIIYFIIIVSLIATLGSLPFIYVDVSIQSRGIVRSVNENNSIQSVVYAEIVKIEIFENKAVNAGDTLIWLRTDELDEQICRLEERQIENSLFIKDLNNLLSNSHKNVSTPKYKSELVQYRTKLAEQDVILKQTKTAYEISKTLYEKGIEARFEHQQTESKYQSSKSQKELVHRQQMNNWQAEMTRLEYENKDLHSQLQQLIKRKKQYIITAPVGGNIVQYNSIQPGNFTQTGQTIAQITISDTLLIECYISSADIGYIEKGQKIQVQVDTYNYQQWGLLEGKVAEILPDIAEINNMPCFRVRCAMNSNYLELPNGYKGYMKKGMTITGRFFLTRRSLLQLLFDKIDDWMNPKIINHGNKS
ncbi:MAG: HlyD family efflux transporter periplasmic adaptor subunit [Dysgonamonadaceae bacterium]|jgi:HlyD family secretion protein|nr:HlyD family efflux transporter periplasmic adaptor subunit [Dysgonamonadaceae bacterium]